MLSHLGSRREASTLADRRRLPISSRGFAPSGALSSTLLLLALAA